MNAHTVLASWLGKAPKTMLKAARIFLGGVELANHQKLVNACLHSNSAAHNVSVCVYSASEQLLMSNWLLLVLCCAAALTLALLRDDTIDLARGVAWPDSWPGWFLRQWVVERLARRLQRCRQRLEEVLAEAVNPLIRKGWIRKLNQFPLDPGHVGPTRVGTCINRAAEQAQKRYGLDIDECLEHLAEAAGSEEGRALYRSRRSLEHAIEDAVWCVLAFPFTVWGEPGTWVLALTAAWLVAFWMIRWRAQRLAHAYAGRIERLVQTKQNRTDLGRRLGVRQAERLATIELGVKISAALAYGPDPAGGGRP